MGVLWVTGGWLVEGAFFRNDQGASIFSFSGPASYCSVNQAELIDLRIGLQEACHHHFQGILVETHFVSLGGLWAKLQLLGILQTFWKK